MAFQAPWMKYSNKKEEVDGIIFDSKREANVYRDLKKQKAAGEIKDFERQVTFILVPNQVERVQTTDKKGRTITKDKVVERAITYIADFVVHHLDGERTVIDAKGAKDKVYVLKRKMIRYVHNIKILEV